VDVDERTCCVCNAFCSKDELGRRDGKWESGVCVRKGLGGDGLLANCGLISTKLMKHPLGQLYTVVNFVHVCSMCIHMCMHPCVTYPERLAVCLRLCDGGLLGRYVGMYLCM
jgi:hypothetical protein